MHNIPEKKRRCVQPDPSQIAEWVRITSLPKDHEEYVRDVSIYLIPLPIHSILFHLKTDLMRANPDLIKSTRNLRRWREHSVEHWLNIASLPSGRHMRERILSEEKADEIL